MCSKDSSCGPHGPQQGCSSEGLRSLGLAKCKGSALSSAVQTPASPPPWPARD